MSTDIYSTGLKLFVEGNSLPGANGAQVTTWADLSGNGRDLTAASAKPVIQTNAVNGKKAVAWDGTKNPLTNSDPFQITSGFMVAKINEFTNFNGLLSTLDHYGILIGNHYLTDKWFNFSYDRFEIRLNDRISPIENAPAPLDEWGIIFFRFWTGLQCDGIQIGSDRAFNGRLLNGSVAMLALYDRGWCESDIRKMHESIASSYQRPIENVFPFQGSKSDQYSIGKQVLSDGQNEPVLRLKRGARKAFDFNFTFRSQSEFKAARAFWDANYPAKSFLWRDYNVITPEDTPVRIPVDSEFEFRGNNGTTVNYGFSGVETANLSPGAIPSAPADKLGDPFYYVIGEENVFINDSKVTG